MDNIEREAQLVKQLGEQIGYGNMMQLASALWRKMLIEKGGPASGAAVSSSLYALKQPNKRFAEESIAKYDKIVKNI